MKPRRIPIRPASEDDLEAINRVIRSAVSQWPLSERVKRLAMPSYLYSEQDLRHLRLIVATAGPVGEVIGVAALDVEPGVSPPEHPDAMRLHGLFVDPGHQRRGVGRLLVERALAMAVRQGRSGLLVKAQPQAVPFFARLGLQRIAVEDERRDYAHRFWLPCSDRQA